MAGEIHRITKETLEKLKAEWTELTTVGRTENARVIEAARLLGLCEGTFTTTLFALFELCDIGSLNSTR